MGSGLELGLGFKLGLELGLGSKSENFLLQPEESAWCGQQHWANIGRVMLRVTSHLLQLVILEPVHTQMQTVSASSEFFSSVFDKPHLTS